MQTDFDILIVGAGLSGIGAAFHVQDKCPALSYAILDGRDAIGGTWDIFRYPGVRSDSDMYTLGYSFYPWKEPRAIADGPAILRYLEETAKHFGIDRHLRLAHKVVGAEWSSKERLWMVSVERKGADLAIRARFLILCCGYYDYERGYTPDYPGLAHFRGEFIHPQQWREEIDYSDKRVIVIGSGATAVTLVPALAQRAKHVIMLQRSPSYLATLPSVDRVAELLKRIIPAHNAHKLIRWKNIVIGLAFFRFCRRFPALARRLLLGQVTKAVVDGKMRMRDFSPSYGPWEQRLCFVPDGDFFVALNKGRAEIVTDTVEKFTESGIELHSGRSLPADIVVSATGLNLKFLGGIAIRIDGNPVDLTQAVPYKGAMLSGIPNLGMAFGYTNASWTLKCDLTCEWLARVIRHMSANGFAVVTPEGEPNVERIPFVDFSSEYFQRAKNILPRQGTRSPWKLNQSYFADWIEFRARKLAGGGLNFS